MNLPFSASEAIFKTVFCPELKLPKTKWKHLWRRLGAIGCNIIDLQTGANWLHIYCRLSICVYNLKDSSAPATYAISIYNATQRPNTVLLAVRAPFSALRREWRPYLHSMDKNVHVCSFKNYSCVVDLTRRKITGLNVCKAVLKCPGSEVCQKRGGEMDECF